MSQPIAALEDRPRLIVTGVEGTLGANLALALSERFSVLGLHHRRAISLDGCRTAPWRPEDEADWKATIQRGAPCWIIHCGPLARSSWEVLAEIPDGTREGRLWVALARLAARLDAELTVLATDAVFAGPRMFHAEDSPAASRRPLGRAAIEAERYLGQSPQVLMVRTHAYGWSPPGEEPGLVERIWTSLVSGGLEPLEVDRHATPILAADLAELLLEAYRRRLTGLYHVAGAERTTPQQFARQLARAFGLPAASPGEKEDRRLLPGPTFGRCPPDRPSVGARCVAQKASVPFFPSAGEAGPLDESSLATGRARQALGRPMPMLREGLDRLVQQARTGYRSRLRARGPLDPLGRAA
jgi:dTDP-4-dehydrorhamnose reductase